MLVCWYRQPWVRWRTYKNSEGAKAKQFSGKTRRKETTERKQSAHSPPYPQMHETILPDPVIGYPNTAIKSTFAEKSAGLAGDYYQSKGRRENNPVNFVFAICRRKGSNWLTTTIFWLAPMYFSYSRLLVLCMLLL